MIISHSSGFRTNWMVLTWRSYTQLQVHAEQGSSHLKISHSQVWCLGQVGWNIWGLARHLFPSFSMWIAWASSWHGSLQVVRRWLAFPRASVLKESNSKRLLMAKPQKSGSFTFTLFYWLKQSQTSQDSRERKNRLLVSVGK